MSVPDTYCRFSIRRRSPTGLYAYVCTRLGFDAYIPYHNRIQHYLPLVCRVDSVIRKLGNALPPALAPHYANVLASLDMFVFQCMPDTRCSEHRLIVPPTCDSRCPPGPDADAPPPALVLPSGATETAPGAAETKQAQRPEETSPETGKDVGSGTAFSPSGAHTSSPSLPAELAGKRPAPLSPAGEMQERGVVRRQACAVVAPREGGASPARHGVRGWLHGELDVPADVASLKDSARVDVAQDPFWLTFKHPDVEGTFTARTAGQCLAVRLNLTYARLR
jgi:hypothetical protein